MPVRWLVFGAALVAGIAGGIAIAIAHQASADGSQGIPAAQQLPNTRLDLGTRLNAVAPGFTLTDQFGRKVSLSSFRGKAVVLSFNDPQCTTICPLTTTAMLEAKKLLGPAAANVQLLGVGANPEATQVKWLRAYSQAHRILHKWLFLTGSLHHLTRVWKSYGVGAAVIHGTIDHTPATYVISPNGRETRLFLTNMSYSSVPQLGVVLARAIAAALPGHPQVRDSTSLAPVELIGPRRHVRLTSAKGTGSFPLGPGNGPHLLLFFNTWDPGIGAGLKGLNAYAKADGAVPLTAIDELNVEPSAATLRPFVRRQNLRYAVGIDPDGRVADGYDVQDSPWLTVVSNSGKILWYYDVAVKGWPSEKFLISHVRAALARAQG